jgi:hypothetical protein
MLSDGLLSSQAKRAIGLVVEGMCPLCGTELRVHDDRACCSCCGDSYRVSTDRLDVRQCPEHGRRCEHWELVYRAAGLGA